MDTDKAYHSHGGGGDNVISLMEICKYQGYPYIILQCCNVVRVSLFSKDTIHIISFQPIRKKRAPKAIH